MEGSVAEFWEESHAGWNLTFRRLINDWEINSVGELLGFIQETRPDSGTTDTRIWIPDPKEGFSVRVCYNSWIAPSNRQFPRGSIWRSLPPLKIVWCMLGSIEQLLQVWPVLKLPVRGKKLVVAIPHAVIWSIWKSRNNAIFNEDKVAVHKIILLLKGLLFSWRELEWARNFRFESFIFNWDAMIQAL
ncbi:hypothetical protein BVC80_8831g18 [Macleaya cordata]|uniref:Reverse transcriptase zinc-binding domain n=1 Tax=Macleaya cordata TaxID=56857 RepID=A0A200RE68_MACCD|nr:hypothetical protein BVC80_8831g18 [Macleaya cordata]